MNSFVLGCSPLHFVGVCHLIRFLFYLDGFKGVAKLQIYGWLNLATCKFYFLTHMSFKEARVFFPHHSIVQVDKIASSPHCTRDLVLIGPLKLTQKTLGRLENLWIKLGLKTK